MPPGGGRAQRCVGALPQQDEGGGVREHAERPRARHAATTTPPTMMMLRVSCRTTRSVAIVWRAASQYPCHYPCYRYHVSPQPTARARLQRFSNGCSALPHPVCAGAGSSHGSHESPRPPQRGR
eukprot:scaffold3231_cov188-Prasinococcus_capsulatus_cf.AAC.1